MVAAALEEAHGWPAGSVEIVPVKTSGDRIQDRPLAEVGGKALWTKELDLALLAGETDCSVHSMKDVESERPETLAIAAMLPRADVRDRLIGADSIAALAAGRGGRHQLAAPRRAAHAASARPHDPFRSAAMSTPGWPSVEAGEVDATLLAAAGLDRLGAAEVGVADRARRDAAGAGAGRDRDRMPLGRRHDGSLAEGDRPCRHASGGAGRACLLPGAGRNLPFAGRGACPGRGR